MLFRKLVDQKEELKTYKKIVKRYRELIDRIIEKCEQQKKIQYHKNHTIPINIIEDLAKSDVQKIYKLEDNLFLTDDD